MPEFKPNTAEVLAMKSRLNCTIEEAQRQALRTKIRNAASNIDSVVDTRRFLMNLVEVMV